MAKKSSSRIFVVLGVLSLVFIVYVFFKQRENFENNDKLQSIIDGVKGGNIDNKSITEYIKNNKLSKEDLDKIIKKLEDANTT